MEIEGTTFGTITIDGKTHEHDVIIRLSGEVVKPEEEAVEEVLRNSERMGQRYQSEYYSDHQKICFPAHYGLSRRQVGESCHVVSFSIILRFRKLRFFVVSRP